MTDVTELAQSLKAAAEKYKSVWGIARYSKAVEARDKFHELVTPANVIALVEALEKTQQERENLRTSFDNERFRADKLKAYIDDMEPIRAAAEKLVRCKGRYHSEQNYRALAALFGVTTPDLPPLDSESSAVTVKLTDINEYLAEVNDKTLNRAFRLLAEGVRAGDVAAMRAAGIKVEDE
ncbi:TPA: ead/Ea22-like family protein [Klebsiella pneumoniae]